MSWNNKEEIETTCTVQQWKKKNQNISYTSYSHHIHSHNIQTGLFFPCFLQGALWYNYATYTNQMHTFQINILIQFLTSSTYFEPHGFILNKTVTSAVFVWYVYMYWCKRSSGWKSVWDL